MSRDDRLFLEDIARSCEKIIGYSSNLTRQQLFEDDKTFDAILRNLGIIGEAIKKVSPELREKRAQIEWRKIAGLRDIVIHEYFGLDYEILWDVISGEIPKLENQIKSTG